MSSFQFRFESLLKYRKRKELLFKREMRPLSEDLSRIEAALDSVRKNLQNYNQNRETLLKDPLLKGSFSTVKAFQRDVQEENRHQKVGVQEKLLAYQDQLKGLITKRKIVEKLREKHYREFLQKEKHRERRELEDFAGVRHRVSSIELNPTESTNLIKGTPSR